MNKKNLLLFSIVCLLLFTISYTYSVFSNKIVGNITATKNDWNYSFNVTGGTVENDYYKVALSGTSGSFNVVLDSTGYSDYISYSIKLDESNLSSDVKFYKDSSCLNEITDNIYSGTLDGNTTITITIYWKSSSSVSGNLFVSSEGKVYVFAMMKNGSNVTYTDKNTATLNGTEFWAETYRLGVKTITFDNDLSNLPSSCTGDADLCWDVSYDSNQENKVYGYLIDTGEDYTDSDNVTRDLYNLYIVSEVPIFAPIDSSDIFKYFKACTTIDFNNNFDTLKVTDMAHMFDNCSSLTSLDVSSFNTSNVTDMYAMFYKLKYVTSLDLSNFNTSKVTDMGYMFGSCSKLTSLDLSNFNTSNVKDMGEMFSYCSKLTSLDISSFNTSNVTSMKRMFMYCRYLTSLDLSSFNTSKVTDMSSMFYWCDSLTSLDLSSFNTSNVTNMWDMFSGCLSLTSLDIGNFNTSNVTNMESMFLNCESLISLDLSSFNTSNVTNMYGMFRFCSSLTTTINIMSTGVTSYDYMFDDAATSNGAQIIVNYIADASALVDNMIATKSGTSNVVKGTVIS